MATQSVIVPITMSFYFRIGFLTLVVLLVQLTIMDVYNFNMVHDNLLALLVIAVAFKVGPTKGATFGFITGLLYGLFTTTIFGSSALEFVLLGFVSGRVINISVIDQLLVKSVVAGILTSVAAVFVAIFLKLLNQATEIDAETVNLILVNFVANTLLFLPMEKLTGSFISKQSNKNQGVNSSV